MKMKWTHILLILFLLSGVSAAQDYLPPIERYHTYDEVVQELEDYAANYEALCRIDSIGTTLEGRTMWAIKISDNPQMDEDEPVILIDGHIHAEEILGVEISMMLIDQLLTGYGNDDQVTFWVDETEIWVVPIGNPDGHQVVFDNTDICYRKNKRDNNHNGVFDYSIAECPGVFPDVPCDENNGAHPECTLINDSDCDGVDLNRNFDWAWAAAADTNQCSEYYVGTAPFSEPEALAIAELARRVRPTFGIIYHSSRSGNLNERIVFPWRDTLFGDSPDYFHIRRVAQEMGREIPTDNEIGTYLATYGKGDKGYVQNWMYAELGTFAFTIEVGICCNIQSRNENYVDNVCERNIQGIHYLLDRCRDNGVITGIVYDQAGNPLPGAFVEVVGVDNDTLLTPRITDNHGRYRRILRPSNSNTYTLEISYPGFETVLIEDIELTDENPVVELDVNLYTSVTPEVISPSVPQGYFLDANFPNPFNPNTTIRYGLAQPGHVQLTIYDVHGKLIRYLMDASQAAGIYAVMWDGTDQQHQPVPSGTYFYTLTSRNFTKTGRAILLK
ncbi:MAG: T9SS C-terminal target domain-containing protein [Gemmatimonadetes bacterium]|nr:MAG: T9SS C-terminal target domain-containing protein [Gemmatimonadota bacterium]